MAVVQQGSTQPSWLTQPNAANKLELDIGSHSTAETVILDVTYSVPSPTSATASYGTQTVPMNVVFSEITTTTSVDQTQTIFAPATVYSTDQWSMTPTSTIALAYTVVVTDTTGAVTTKVVSWARNDSTNKLDFTIQSTDGTDV